MTTGGGAAGIGGGSRGFFDNFHCARVDVHTYYLPVFVRVRVSSKQFLRSGPIDRISGQNRRIRRKQQQR